MTHRVSRLEFSSRPPAATGKPMMKRLAGAMAVAGLFLASACLKPARAIDIPFSDRATFTAATVPGSLRTADFEVAPPGTFLDVTPSFSEQGAIFAVSPGNVLTIADAGAENFGTGDSLLVGGGAVNPPPPPIFLDVSLPSNITAVGFDFGPRSRVLSDFTFTINGSPARTFVSAATTRSFFGVASDTVFSSLRIQSTVSQQFFVDQFSFGQSNLSVTAVPEPGTMTLMGLGLAGLIGAARRRKKAQEPASETV